MTMPWKSSCHLARPPRHEQMRFDSCIDRSRVSLSFFIFMFSPESCFRQFRYYLMSFSRILQEFFQSRFLKLFESKKHEILLLKFLRVFKHFNSQNVSIHPLLYLQNYVNLNLFHANTRRLVRRSVIIL